MNRTIIGFVDETHMHGNVFGKIDALRKALGILATTSGLVVTYNRLYLNGETVMLNITIAKTMYLITSDDSGYSVSKSNKKTSQSEKRVVQYDHIEDGSFMEMFTK